MYIPRLLVVDASEEEDETAGDAGDRRRREQVLLLAMCMLNVLSGRPMLLLSLGDVCLLLRLQVMMKCAVPTAGEEADCGWWMGV